MSVPWLSNLNLNKNELQNATLQPLASAPSSPATGQMYYDTVATAPLWYNGSAWTNVATNSALLGGQNSAYHLARANHTGTQLANTISNFDTQVQTSRLDQMAAPTGSVSMNSQKIINLANGTNPNDAVNYSQLNALIQGIEIKQTVLAATTAALPACTYNNGTSGVGATLTGNANGAIAAVDGITLAANDLVLVKNQAAPEENGPYVVTTVGSGGAPFVLTRVDNMDQATEFGGALIAVQDGGTVNENTIWICNCAASITVGTTAVTFTQVNSPTTYTAGNSGISISGLAISAVAGAGITISSGIAIDTAVVVRKYAVDVGDGSSTSITVTHNLGTRDVIMRVYQNSSTWDQVVVECRHATTNTCTLIFTVAPASAAYRAVVHA